VRIVADTNTVVSGLLWQGPPRRIVDAGRRRLITLCTSPALLAELDDVLGRKKFARRLRETELTAEGLFQDFRRIAVVIEPEPLPGPRQPRSRRRSCARLRARCTCRFHRLRRR
jgi:putative PIN family toxin of toxin-antitoxin system